MDQSLAFVSGTFCSNAGGVSIQREVCLSPSVCKLSLYTTQTVGFVKFQLCIDFSSYSAMQNHRKGTYTCIHYLSITIYFHCLNICTTKKNIMSVTLLSFPWLRTQDDPVAPPIDLGMPDPSILQLRLRKFFQRFSIHIQRVLQ